MRGPFPDATYGELPCACIVRKPGDDTVEQLPTTSTGKIMRRELIKYFMS